MARILLFLSWTLTLYDVAFAKGPSCLYKQDESQAEHMCFKVTCRKKDYVIADIQLVSGRRKNDKAAISKDNSLCMGETAGFIDQSMNCFWKSECSIQYPRGPIITSRKGELDSFIKVQEHEMPNDTDCIKINESLDFACIITAKCVKEKHIIDMAKSKTVIRQKMGIIRSHRLYPWYYENKKMEEISGFNLTKNIPQSKKIQVRFHDLDIYEGDVITMATQKRTVKFNGTMNDDTVKAVTFEHSDSYVNINYNQSIEAYDPFRGFIICFKEEWARRRKGGREKKNKKGKKKRSRREEGNENNPCNSVMKRAKVQTSDPYSKACLKDINRNKKPKNCCCDVNNKEKRKSAINLAKCMHHLAAHPDSDCDHIPLV